MSSFLVSDLAKQRTEVLKAARQGGAIIRDNKGPELVMLPNSRLVNLELHKDWSLKLERLRYILQSESRPDVAGWGDLAWLRVFDELLSDWKATAGQLEDPLRRKILLSPGLDRDDFAEARDPKAMEEIE